MDDAEIGRRAIGLLTLAYNANTGTATGSDRADAFAETVASLMEGWGEHALNIEVPIEYAAGVRAGLDDMRQEISSQVTSLVGHLISAFVILCREVRAANPDADIDGFLQGLALTAAEEE